MPNANPQNNFLQEILNRLTAIDEKVDQEFQKFQQQTQAFIQESRTFQNAMMNTVKDIARLLERIENKQIIIQETFAQLKEENAKLKQEKSAQDVIIRNQDATIKKLEQRVAALEALQS